MNNPTSTPDNKSPLSTVDWDDILETLEAQKCVLFIGSGAFDAPGGGDIDHAFCEYLDSQNADHPHIRMHNPGGFFLFKKSRFRRKVVAEMKTFYNQSFPETESFFSKIARMPFSMIVTLTPDNILTRTFDMKGLDYQADFYYRNQKASDQFEKPTTNKPLIYNLLGNIEEPNSLVLTHSDFFDYLQSVFKDISMNEDLKDELEDMERYIFLGLPFEKWYFQLLLRVLSLHSDKLKEIERLALKKFENPFLHKLYTEEFKMEFFPASSQEFINEMYRQCEQEDLLKPLPKIDPKLANMPDASRAELQEMVANGRTKKAIIHLKITLSKQKMTQKQAYNDILVLSNRFNLLSQREMRGTIDSRDFSVENNQIIEQLLDLITTTQNG